MSDRPLTKAAFEAFQIELFSHLTGIDRRFETLEQKMDTRFDEVAGQIDAVLHRVLPLEDEYVAVKEGLSRLEKTVRVRERGRAARRERGRS
jgi:hypothetical protein